MLRNINASASEVGVRCSHITPRAQHGGDNVSCGSHAPYSGVMRTADRLTHAISYWCVM